MFDYEGIKVYNNEYSKIRMFIFEVRDGRTIFNV